MEITTSDSLLHEEMKPIYESPQCISIRLHPSQIVMQSPPNQGGSGGDIPIEDM